MPLCAHRTRYSMAYWHSDTIMGGGRGAAVCVYDYATTHDLGTMLLCIVVWYDCSIGGDMYKRDKARAAEWQREYRMAHPERTRETSRRSYQKDKKPAFDRVARRKAMLVLAGPMFTQDEWDSLKQLYGNRCLCCGAWGRLEPDHIVPVCKGGTNAISNIQPLCPTCNGRKWIRSIDYRPGDYSI